MLWKAILLPLGDQAGENVGGVGAAAGLEGLDGRRAPEAVGVWWLDQGDVEAKAGEGPVGGGAEGGAVVADDDETAVEAGLDDAVGLDGLRRIQQIDAGRREGCGAAAARSRLESSPSSEAVNRVLEWDS